MTSSPVFEYVRNIWMGISSTAIGMGITLRHLFSPDVTLQYPIHKKILPERSRMKLFNKIEDCIGCKQCEKVCPVSCITITTEKRDKTEPEIKASTGTPIKLRTIQFDIDMTQCCYCGLCTYPCPTECLVMTPEFEFAEFDKQQFLYRFAKDEPKFTDLNAPPKGKKTA